MSYAIICHSFGFLWIYDRPVLNLPCFITYVEASTQCVSVAVLIKDMIVLVLSFYLVQKWVTNFIYYLCSNVFTWSLYIFLALQSDDEIDEVLEEEIEKQQQRKHPLPRLNKRKTTDELPPTPPLMEANDTNYPDPAVIAAANEASALYKAIVTSILESEAIYLEALSVMLQYMKAMKVTLSTVRIFFIRLTTGYPKQKPIQ